MIVSATGIATTNPVRNPMNRSTTPKTTPTDWNRLPMNVRIRTSTTSGWNRATSNSTPIGYLAWRRAISRRTPAPSATTSPPSRMEIASASAGVPEA